MSHLKDGPSLKFQLSIFTALVFHQTAVFLFLTNSCEGQSQLIGPPQPIVAILGEDIILPCHLEPAMDAVAMTVEWARPDLKPRFIYVWRDAQELLTDQNPSYKGRTSLFINKLKHGDVSLKLSEVKLSDEGRYRCFIPSLGKPSTVDLIVGSASSPVLGINKDPSGVVLECESKGWYPEPELFWLDAEGKLLSAGAPETLRGPDGLYTVSSRVTVEKSHSSSFTCRVQQSKIQQTRETQIHVQGDFFMDTPTADCSCSSEHIIIGFAVVFLCISVALLVYKWRQNKIEAKTQQREGEKTESVRNNMELEVLMDGERNGEKASTESDATKSLDTKNAKLEKQQKKENEEKQMEPDKQIETLKSQLEEAERQREENERNLQEIKTQKEAAEKKKNEYEQYLRETYGGLCDRRQELETKLQEAKDSLMVLNKTEKINQLREELDVIKKMADTLNSKVCIDPKEETEP